MKRMDIHGSRTTVNEALGMTVLRVVTGVIMAAHGWQKVMGFGAWRDQVAQLGIPVPEIAAPLAMLAELLGGLGLILGAGTRLAALAVMFVMLVAITTVHLTKGLFAQQGGFEFPLLILASTLYFLAAGAGPISVDAILRRRAQRRAIQTDRRWQQPPYVPVPDEAIYQRQSLRDEQHPGDRRTPRPPSRH